MRSKLIGLVIGLGLAAGLTGSAFACAFHDQQAAAAQQQTAQAQDQTPTSTQ